MFLKISTILLIPSLIIQGNAVKKKTLRLAEPEGNRQGMIGSGSPLSILILGDSAAAGVGVEIQEDALLGAVLNQLKDQYEITYMLEAKTGHSTGQVFKTAKSMSAQHFDVVITSVGVNDITKLTSPKNWIKKQQQLYTEINQKFTPALIIASGVPPMNMFPALPNPLAWLFGQYAKGMNQNLSKFILQQANMQWIEYDLEHFKVLDLAMATDGFHPSKEIYALWGKQVADKIRQMF
ncbi:SGNH/GDSL hydrolase family protein [Acinetobacter sp. ANC 4779]|uniref:SGNH/GDSL hydrolase family protein n=1 Tax=Acinetobacter sp. ANC 4779 TaxID=2529848 RepID=UPI00103D638B|nr:SGNH/GDSL hydrolase family protein [Acinetobacter sp. ANC 4779]TCB50657.1 SGNH/GDSL hydrolase family protein [Acinetobacter sp. ANC 4779]